MEILTAIFKSKEQVENERQIQIVIKSWEDYKCHELNIMRDCLNCWSHSNDRNIRPSLKYRYIEVDPETDHRMYFVSMTVGQAKCHHIYESILEHDCLNYGYYMDSDIANMMYREREQVA